jgi:hypothetical protein
VASHLQQLLDLLQSLLEGLHNLLRGLSPSNPLEEARGCKLLNQAPAYGFERPKAVIFETSSSNITTDLFFAISKQARREVLSAS